MRRAGENPSNTGNTVGYAWGMLTSRQREILAMFCSGMSYREVASRLGLSPETINPSLKQSARRLGVGGIGREVLRAAAEAAGESLEVESLVRVEGEAGESVSGTKRS